MLSPEGAPKCLKCTIFLTRAMWWKTLANVCLSAQWIWFLINMNKITSHAEFTLVRCVCVFCICGVCVCVWVCIYVEFQSNVSLKAPLCSLLHISRITTPISVSLLHFSFSLHPSIAAPSLAALSTNIPSLRALSLRSLPCSLSHTLVANAGRGDHSMAFSCAVAIWWRW